MVSRGPNLGQQAVELWTQAGVARPVLEGCWFSDGFVGTMGELMCAIEEGREPSHGARGNLDSLALCFAAIAITSARSAALEAWDGPGASSTRSADADATSNRASRSARWRQSERRRASVAINPVHQSMDDARDSFSASQTVGRIIRAGRTCRFGRVCDRCSRWNSEGVMPALCRKRW